MDERREFGPDGDRGNCRVKSGVERDATPVAAATQKHGQASTRAEMARAAGNGMEFASALSRTRGSTLVGLMMGLQRQAGNLAVESLVAASSTSTASVQRAAPIDDDRHLSAPLLSSHPRLDQAFHNNPPLGPTDAPEDIAAFQAALAQVIGPLPGSFNAATQTFDGRWGRETVAAVRRYQADRGIPPGGGRQVGGRSVRSTPICVGASNQSLNPFTSTPMSLASENFRPALRGSSRKRPTALCSSAFR